MQYSVGGEQIKDLLIKRVTMLDKNEQYETIPQHTTPISVSELNKNAKLVVEQCFPSIFVTGEISNCMRPRSGHYYFSLKDSGAQISCAMFKSYQGSLEQPLEDGMQVNIRGKLSIYPERGSYQLIATKLEPAGDGLLKIEFEKLKAKLNAEGLFADENKQAIPKMPKTIGVVTSATGAAIQDIIKVLKHRYSAATIIIYPTLVQGNEAKHQIVKAIETATGRNECDILLIARGGGSYEDLWCFNEEIVARAIAACSIPIITGIGHEVDITIADFVADLRAATPSQAAQFATPDQNELITIVANYSKELEHKIKNLLKRYALELESQAKQLQHPLQKIHNWSQMLDNSEANLHHNWHSLMQKKLATLTTLMAKIEALSPMQTLQRGYSIASSKSKIINSIANIKPGDKFDLKVKDGIIKNIVESIIPQEEQVHE